MTVIDEAGIATEIVSTQPDTRSLTETPRHWVNTSERFVLADAVLDGGTVSGRYVGTSITATEPVQKMEPLPVCGDRVDLRAQVPGRGWFVAPDPETILDGWIVAELWDGKEIVRANVPIFFLHPDRCIQQGLALEADKALLLAGLAEARADRFRLKREHTAWVDSLVSDMHAAADDANLCEDFDNFMEEHNLRAREREYEVTMAVTVRVPVTVEASSAQRAIEKIIDNPDLARSDLACAVDNGAPLDVVDDD